ncbi:alpha/beta hydrolase [Achromobacter sp. K91]|uniref:alpha/beta fold hydrolase n=1 Tax=Achromobacter sp. K91 TaxID=2292262 RepID=UPI000E66B410|nr:alpha/beta hydrolase [Achromobacter sp. K91]RIJ03591.1 alpha/beta hydrolase [Achromobacter sp. K91]
MNAIVQKLRAAAALAQQDSEFILAARGLPCALWLQAGAAAQERVTAWAGQPTAPSQCITISAPPETWRKLLSDTPPPGYHSFTAARRQAQGLRVTGDALAIAQALHPLERLFEILRGQLDATPDLLDRSAIAGSYATIDIGAAQTSIYYETSGLAVGPALLMLHTAGADSRQYHALMADPGLRRQWRMIAFDMPGHGRSMPLPGQAWIDAGLSRDAYLQTCLAVIRQVAGGPATLLGCSMGAAMALVVAAHSPADVAGVVALEAPYQAAGRRTPMLCHPQVNQAAHNPAYVRGLMGPAATLQARRDAAWIYSQGGFNVYANDLWFYSEDFDAARHLTGLNADAFGISLLTGAYDYSASPEDSRRVAALIPGARFQAMPELGHFPMVENPQRLLEYLRPELDRLRATGAIA